MQALRTGGGAERSGSAWRLEKIWQTRGLAARALWPLAQLYRAAVALRRALYRAGWIGSAHPGRPVIVVGNVIAGGAGKTPVLIALAEHLQARGLRVGVIARGHGRRSRDCRAVLPASPAALVGDEAALIARRCAAAAPAVAVHVARRRIDAARALLAAHPQTDVLLSDDGLQHLALRRDLEICVFNDQATGNGWLLPAGPLREAWPRAVDFVLYAGAAPPAGVAAALPAAPGRASPPPAFGLRRSLADYALRCDGSRVPLAELRGRPLHALAAVARPDEFFAQLRGLGLDLVRTEAFPDHHDFDRYKHPFDQHMPLICTEKDAVKLWPRNAQALAVPLLLEIDARFFAALDSRLAALAPSPARAAAPLSCPPA